jgi:hypothetical protein
MYSVETIQIYLNNEKEDLKTYPRFSFASAKANDVELRKALRGWVRGRKKLSPMLGLYACGSKYTIVIEL